MTRAGLVLILRWLHSHELGRLLDSTPLEALDRSRLEAFRRER